MRPFTISKPRRKLGIDPEFYKNRDIHIHFRGAVPRTDLGRHHDRHRSYLRTHGAPVRRELA